MDAERRMKKKNKKDKWIKSSGGRGEVSREGTLGGTATWGARA